MNDESLGKSIIDVTNINEKIYRLIKERIIHREYLPGHQINVRKLQEELGVSSSPIKDALNQLAGEGFVDITSRKGTFVKGVSMQELSEIEQLRTILEIGALDIIAGNINDEQLAQLEKIHRDLVAERDYEKFMELDRNFHLKIISMANNQRLTATYESLNIHNQIMRFNLERDRTSPDPMTIPSHAKILEALKTRDLQSGKDAIQDHRNRRKEYREH